MQSAGFRRELVSWMRLNDMHPRAGLDGIDRASLRLSRGEARAVPFVLIKLWRFLNAIGFTKSITSEYELTLTAPVIALFQSDITENTVASGRAYLRLCLEAASLGFAGWPMAAVSDHLTTNRQVCDRFGIAPDRRLVQVIRFGIPTGDAPRRSRRPLAEVLRNSRF